MIANTGKNPTVVALRDSLFGAVAATVAFFAFAVLTPLRQAITPDVKWGWQGETYAYPAILLVFTAVVGIPGAFGGALVSRLARHRRGYWLGLTGIALGGVAHAADTWLNVLPGGAVVGILMLAFPLIGGLVGVVIGNRKLSEPRSS